ncbi:uncharacterized protein LOC144453401 [Glandiceps talaboti]
MSSDDNHNVPSKYGSSFKKFLGRRKLSAQSMTSISTVGDSDTMSTTGRTFSSRRKFVNVVLPTQEETQVAVESKARGQDLFDQVVALLGIEESQYFGIAIQQDCEFEFIDFKLKLSKYAPKAWKNDSGYGADKAGKPLFTVYFKVQFYVEHVNLIVDDVTRHHYFLQLRHNILESPLPCSEENYFLLAAYALQADIGNYLCSIHKRNYFEAEKYFPKWVLERRGEDYILDNVPGMHCDQRGMSKTEAQNEFIKQASSCLEFVMHFYSVKKNKSDSMPYILIGVGTKGLQIYYEDVGGTKYLKYEYPWNSIRKLHFEKKKFAILAEGVPESRKLVYHCSTDSRAKNVLQLCKVTHSFQVHTQVLVDKLKKIDQANEKKKYRESYISGELEWDLDQMLAAGGGGYPEKELQRNSVISTGSSNTTSGIVGDDKLEPIFDKSLTEEDEEFEHMITGPPFVDQGRVSFEFTAPDENYPTRSSQSFVDSEPILAMNPIDQAEYSERYALTQVENSILLEETPVKIKQSMDQKNRHSQGYFSITGQSENTDSEWSMEEEMELMFDQLKKEEPTIQEVVVTTSSLTPTVETPTTTMESKNEVTHGSSISVETSPKPKSKARQEQQSVQEELKKLRKSKEADVPLLSALCNDKTLLALAQKQEEGVQPETPPMCRPDTDSHASSTSSTLKEKASRNTSLNTLIVDSNSSVESENNSKSAEGGLEPYRTSHLGSLNKHQTLPTLSGAGAKLHENKLHVDTALANSADGKVKCQTLPAKMNAGGNVIPSGDAEDIFRDDVTSFSAPNLSPQPQVVSPGC